MRELRAPYPWTGGKRKVAPVVWRAFGADIPNTDGRVRIAETWHDKDDAKWARRQWQKREKAGRRYRVVRYVPDGGRR